MGSGIFGIPQNMAAGAGAGAILIGWTITGFGMLMLARVYRASIYRSRVGLLGIDMCFGHSGCHDAGNRTSDTVKRLELDSNETTPTTDCGESVMTMPKGLYSEVGRLRKVLVWASRA